ncbi:MAG TPA: hypothetical protein VIA45_09910 [Thermoanaerobaculia bacterium]|jgi:hypothetical protein
MIRRNWRPIPLVLFLVFVVVAGARDVVNEWPSAAKMGQKAATAAEAGYVLAAVASLAALAMRRPWARAAAWAWAALTTATGFLAAMFWGEAGVAASLAGAAGCAAVCAGLIALAFRRPRGLGAGDAA